MQKLIRTYFNILSFLFPIVAGNQSFEIFQRTFGHSRRFRKKELDFYEKSSRFTAPWEPEDLNCYELGNPANEMVVLVHGWNSNAGSLNDIANTLAKAGYYVVTFDLPAHGLSKLDKTNLAKCSSAFLAFIHRLLPHKPFSVVSHSFGSLVVSHALAGSRYNIDRWIMLTSPNRVTDIFTEYRDMMGLRKKAYTHMVGKAEVILKERLEDVSVEKKISEITYESLLIMHDRFDRVLPYNNSVAIDKSAANCRLEVLENAGHYKMLSNKEVLNEILGFLAPTKGQVASLKQQASLQN